MTLKLSKITKNDYKAVKKLYLSAFPREERPPFFMLKSGVKKGSGDFFVAKDGEIFVGFAYIVTHADLAYLFYFAIDGGLRGKGYGSAVLTELKEIYKGKRFFLAREMLEPDAENYSERVKRREFYLKNGFTDLPVKIKEASVTFDVMGVDCSVKKEEYDEMMTAFCGKLIRKLVDMRMIED